MAKLQHVDPRTLSQNPDNPRRTSAPQAMDDQLLASIKTVGIIHPPIVTDRNGVLTIEDGDRRVAQAIRAELSEIEVLVADYDEAKSLMRSVSANQVRASMNPVDTWRAIDGLEKRGWTEQAIADALALPARTVRRLKLLAQLHPPMLEVMATGSMPNEDQLRTIAAASRNEQAQTWKKYRRRNGHDVDWYSLARALAKRRMLYSAAKFNEDLAHAYGVVWEDDLFAPADEDGRYTTNVEGFFGAQKEWLRSSLPERAVLLTQDEYGQPVLPKKAERVWGKPDKSSITGYYLDQHSAEVKTAVYRMPADKKPTTAKNTATGAGGLNTLAEPAHSRPDVTQKGCAVIGDFRTDALHEALRESQIDDTTMIALLVLALSANNVSVHSGLDSGRFERDTISASINEGGLVTSDANQIRAAARTMLTTVLSCRTNMSNSGIVARVAGETIGAAQHLPHMATEEFLKCLSRAALEKVAKDAGAPVDVRVKDTRAALISRLASNAYVYPGALFRLTEQEIADARHADSYGYVPGSAAEDDEGADWSDDDPNGDEPGFTDD